MLILTNWHGLGVDWGVRTLAKLTESQRAAHIQKTIEYNRTNMKQVKINLRYGVDDDIIEFLQGTDNVQGLIKELIRKRIPKE